MYWFAGCCQGGEKAKTEGNVYVTKLKKFIELLIEHTHSKGSPSQKQTNKTKVLASAAHILKLK